jgi:hypothetical protein
VKPAIDPVFLNKLRLHDALKWPLSLAHMKCGAIDCGKDYVLAVSNHLNGRLRADTFLAASASDGWAIVKVGLNRGVVLCRDCLKEMYLELTEEIESADIDEDGFARATRQFSMVIEAISTMQARWSRIFVEERTPDLRD